MCRVSVVRISILYTWGWEPSSDSFFNYFQEDSIDGSVIVVVQNDTRYARQTARLHYGKHQTSSVISLGWPSASGQKQLRALGEVK